MCVTINICECSVILAKRPVLAKFAKYSTRNSNTKVSHAILSGVLCPMLVALSEIFLFQQQDSQGATYLWLDSHVTVIFVICHVNNILCHLCVALFHCCILYAHRGQSGNI